MQNQDYVNAIYKCRQPCTVYQNQITHALTNNLDKISESKSDLGVVAILPGVHPEWLGSRSFIQQHHVRFPYVAGAMANGIASAEMVIVMTNQNMLSFFG